MAFAALFISTLAAADVGDLLISEISVSPTTGEFIEIYNSGASSVDLSDVYLTDATFSPNSVYYYNIVINAGGGGGFADFHARFPDAATIAAGEYQTIALNGSADFITAYGVNPTYKISNDAVADSIPPMREARSGSIDGNDSGLSTGEVAVLYYWDGQSDLVKDLDYVLWGDKFEAVDKSGISIDSLTDADSATSTYANDTATTSQAAISATAHADGSSWQRIGSSEGLEVQSGGNGFNGSDETSEDFNNTFFEGTPSPNAAGTPPPPSAPAILINEVDAVGSVEFIEIFGAPGTSLNDVTVVFYEGTNNTIYNLIDLSGNNIGASGYFLIGDASLPAEDITLAANSLNDEASAVAIYFSNISNFSNGGALTTTDIIDALVYDSGQIDNATLLTLLNASQAQINEDSNSNAAAESNARCPNGSGGARNTSTYNQTPPTAGTINNTCPLGDYYANVDTTNASTLRTTVHNIIKESIAFPYSSGTTDTWDILSFADEDHNTNVDLDANSGGTVVEGVWMLYKNNSYPYNGGGQQAYNREHSWPKSYGFSNPTNNAPRTDAHHLMMSDAGYNSTRGNKYYGNCDPGSDNTCSPVQTDAYNGEGANGTVVGGNTGSTYPGNANWTNNVVFETWNFRKGDVARAMFYMDVRYEGDRTDNFGVPEPDLILTDDANLIQTTATSPAYMGLLSVLLDWHTQDPVDDIERRRNEEVFAYQTNRNPFVDHPEWVACIFQDDCASLDVIFTSGFE